MRVFAAFIGAAMIAAAGLLASVGSSSAMPAAPVQKPAAEAGLVQKAADGCGRGFVRNYRGRCVPIRGYRGGPVYVPAPRYYYAPRYVVPAPRYYAPRYYAPRYYGGPRYYGPGWRY